MVITTCLMSILSEGCDARENLGSHSLYEMGFQQMKVTPYARRSVVWPIKNRVCSLSPHKFLYLAIVELGDDLDLLGPISYQLSVCTNHFLVPLGL